jgi:excisionase family DNA binding protein
MTRYESIAMTLREVAERLEIGKSSAYRLVASGELRGFRVGPGPDAAWRVLRRDFDEYIEQRLVAAQERHERARSGVA